MSTPVTATDLPDADDLREYLGAQINGLVDSGQLDDALKAAIERVYERCIFAPGPLPDVARQGVLMTAARLYRRRYSVSGYEGFGDIGIARVPTLDPDVEDLLIRYLRYDFA